MTAAQPPAQPPSHQHAPDRGPDDLLFFITYPQRIHELARRYTPIWAPNESVARNLVFSTIGPVWAFMYNGQAELDRQVHLFGLHPISLPDTRMILGKLGESHLPPEVDNPNGESK